MQGRDSTDPSEVQQIQSELERLRDKRALVDDPTSAWRLMPESSNLNPPRTCTGVELVEEEPEPEESDEIKKLRAELEKLKAKLAETKDKNIISVSR